MKKRVISILLAACMAAAIVCVGATPASAAGTDEVVAAIEAYNLNHGGVGSLVATVTGANEVTVTGSVTGATKELRIAPWYNDPLLVLHWKATLTSSFSGDFLYVSANLYIHEGSYISGHTIRNSSGNINILGGTVEALIYCAGNGDDDMPDGGNITVDGGNVNGWLSATSGIHITGGIVTGDIVGGSEGVTITGGIVNAWYIADYDYGFWGLTIGKDATLNVLTSPWIPGPQINVFAIYIEPGATLSNFPTTGYIKAKDIDRKKLTVIGDVGRSIYYGDRRLSNTNTLIIPKCASLHLNGGYYADGLFLDGGTLIINGAFTYDDAKSLHFTSGIIKGKNAGSLAGIYGSPLWDSLPGFIQRPLFKALVWLGVDEWFARTLGAF